MRQPTGPVPPDDQLSGSTRRQSFPAAASRTSRIVVGGGASVSGRVVFEGATPPPPSPGEARVPFFSADGMGCRQGTAKVEADWTFKIEKVSGTCGAPPTPILRTMGTEVDSDQRSERRRSNVHVRARPESDECSGRRVRQALAARSRRQRRRWPGDERIRRARVPDRQAEVDVSVAPDTNAVADAGSRCGGYSRIHAAARPRGGESVQSATAAHRRAAAGEYYIIAIDDIEFEDSQDPSVLEKLAANALRVTVTDDGPIEVPLRRFSFADVMR